ncbi:uncharacterized protein [Spinacia oleracea]|uniref:Uncharacterized protein n=1 Tax=Spinacia oleracea TaxID=3562 RepID=A0ABM3QR67_SPIOL|nr:uncharacterized protein LOC130461702 [Spinacia oleracea]
MELMFNLVLDKLEVLRTDVSTMYYKQIFIENLSRDNNEGLSGGQITGGNSAGTGNDEYGSEENKETVALEVVKKQKSDEGSRKLEKDRDEKDNSVNVEESGKDADNMMADEDGTDARKLNEEEDYQRIQEERERLEKEERERLENEERERLENEERKRLEKKQEEDREMERHELEKQRQEDRVVEETDGQETLDGEESGCLNSEETTKNMNTEEAKLETEENKERDNTTTEKENIKLEEEKQEQERVDMAGRKVVEEPGSLLAEAEKNNSQDKTNQQMPVGEDEEPGDEMHNNDGDKGNKDDDAVGSSSESVKGNAGDDVDNNDCGPKNKVCDKNSEDDGLVGGGSRESLKRKASDAPPPEKAPKEQKIFAGKDEQVLPFKIERSKMRASMGNMLTTSAKHIAEYVFDDRRDKCEILVKCKEFDASRLELRNLYPTSLVSDQVMDLKKLQGGTIGWSLPSYLTGDPEKC